MYFETTCAKAMNRRPLFKNVIVNCSQDDYFLIQLVFCSSVCAKTMFVLTTGDVGITLLKQGAYFLSELPIWWCTI